MSSAPVWRPVIPDLDFLESIRQGLELVSAARITLHGPEYEYMLGSHHQGLCRVILDTEAGRQICEEDRDDHLSAACASRDWTPVSHVCVFGMLNVIAPVWVDQERIGFAVSSATLPRQLTTQRRERLIRRVADLGVSPARARRALAGVPVIREETLLKILALARECMEEAYRNSRSAHPPARRYRAARGMAEAQARLELERARREIELRNLISQVNPHFLFNALNLISSFAMQGDYERVQLTVGTLADLLRYGLSSEGQLVSLREELEHVRNYVRIQGERFPGKVEAEVSAEEEALGAQLPKISLQPLVENCFRHGFVAGQSRCVLRVRGEVRGGTVEVRVEDNGVGMGATRIKRVMRQSLVRGERPPDGIGIANVQRRLRYYFGDQAGLEIESRERQGTCITLRVPFRNQYC